MWFCMSETRERAVCSGCVQIEDVCCCLRLKNREAKSLREEKRVACRYVKCEGVSCCGC